MVSVSDFDFDTFFKKYNLEFSDDLLNMVVSILETKKNIYRSRSAYNFVYGLICTRCPELEPIILEDHVAAYRYARDVIKDRWLEAEPIIRKSYYWDLYRDYWKIL